MERRLPSGGAGNTECAARRLTLFKSIIGLTIAAAAPAMAATAIPAALQAQLTTSAAATADPDSVEPSRQVDLARAHLSLCVEAWGPASQQTAACELELGRALLVEMFPAEAKSVLTSAIVHLGSAPDPQALARAQSLLGEALIWRGQHEEALGLMTSALAVQTDPAQRSLTLRRQANVLAAQGKLPELQAAITAARGLAETSALTVHDQALLDLAGALNEVTRHPAQAVSLNRAALAKMEKRFGATDSRLGFPLARLGDSLFVAEGHMASEPFRERALAIERARPRPNPHRETAALVDLSSVWAASGRLIPAMTILKEAVARSETEDTEGLLATRLRRLGEMQAQAGQLEAAISSLERAVPASEALAGGNPATTGIILQTLALTYGRVGRATDAEAAARRSVMLRERLYGLNHIVTLTARAVLGGLLLDTSPTEAARLLEPAVNAIAVQFGNEHPRTQTYRALLAAALAKSGRPDAAITEIDTSIDVLRQPLLGTQILNSVGSQLGLAWSNDVFAALKAAVYWLPPTDGARAARAFALLQLDEAATGLSTIAWQAAARRSISNPKIKALVEAQRIEQIALTSLRRNVVNKADTLTVVPQITALKERMAALDAQIAAADPAFASLSRRQEVPLADMNSGRQPLLRRHEAMIAFMQNYDAIRVLVITRDGTFMNTLPDTRREVLAAQVAALRRGLVIDAALTAADLPEFDVAASHALYARVIAPLLPHLKGITTLQIVADGPLARLPLGLLVSRPAKDADLLARYRNSRWLADRFAVVVPPGIAALAAARSIDAPSRADRMLLAVADPALTGIIPGTTPRATQVAGLAGFVKLRGDERGTARTAAAICAMQPLPDTRREAERVARALGKQGITTLLTGAQASEREVRLRSDNGDLARYRAVLFATHGLTDNEASGEEPALVLAPASCSSNDAAEDGLLSASEIATLKLDADLVILSGCNTAAPGDALVGQPFSGLAQAFRQAGARRLLVSHWSVDSAATADFMGSLFANRRPVTAASLQTTMQAMRHSPGRFAYRSHPAFWAPFVLVGDSR